MESILLQNGCQFNGSGGETHIYVNGHSLSNVIETDDPDSYFYQFFVDSGASVALNSCSYDLDVSYAAQIRGLLDINSYIMNVQYFDVYENGNLIIDSGGLVNVTVNGPYFHSTGSLTMVSGSELISASNIQFQTGSIENVSGGDITLQGSFTNYDEIFTPTGGSVIFGGSSAASIIGTTAFHDLNISKAGATVTSNAPFSMYDLLINSGILDPGGNDVEVLGNWANNVGDAGFIEGTQTVTFGGTNDVNITTGETFYNLTLDKGNAVIANFDGNLTIGNDLVINPGSIYSGDNTISVYGNVAVNSGGVLYMQPNGTLALDAASNLNIYGGGYLYVLGSAGNYATVTHLTTGNYAFNVYSGGTISAEYGLFEHMTDNGVYVWIGGNVDPNHSFNYCTFQNGYVGPGTLLYIDNYDDVTITGANFPDNSSTTYNVAKVHEPPAGQGNISMVDYSGIFSGETYEYDPYNRITWSGLPEIDDLTIQYSAGNIILNWTYPQPVTQFKVYRSTDPYDFSGATVFTTPTVGYSEPTNSTNYFYRVTAENISEARVLGETARSSDSAPWKK